jgi:CTP:molybdopterin cytidylyltransferase MocA
LIAISPAAQGAILMLADQPGITTAHLNDLPVSAAAAQVPIAAASYAGTLGTPCYFSQAIFPQLLALPDDRGGKAILLQDPARVATLRIPEAELDVDTPVDFARARQRYGFYRTRTMLTHASVPLMPTLPSSFTSKPEHESQTRW